jgi:oligopeptide/dipeptide ABC transporter ATP-binding protein
LEQVTKDYSAGHGRTIRALDGVDLDVEDGETLGVVGESGSGKSTLARLMVGLVVPTSGRVLLGGRDSRSFAKRELRKHVRARTQMVFQEPYASLNPRMKIATLLERPMIVHGLGSRQERRRRCCELIELVGMAESHLDRYPNEFSGGQQQRIAIARALAARPSTLILDEPTSALDTSVQAQILNLLDDVRREIGMTYVLISHNLAVVHFMSNRVAVMYSGQIVELAATDVLFENTLHPYTQMLIAAVPKLTGKSAEHAAAAKQGAVGRANLAVAPGCRFFGRCRLAEARCQQEMPELRNLALPGQPPHLVRCHLV